MNNPLRLKDAPYSSPVWRTWSFVLLIIDHDAARNLESATIDKLAGDGPLGSTKLKQSEPFVGIPENHWPLIKSELERQGYRTEELASTSEYKIIW
jgi:hypothetical protein